MGAKAKRQARACGGRCPEAADLREDRDHLYAVEIPGLTEERDRAVEQAGRLSASLIQLQGDLALAQQRIEELRRELAAAESRQGVRP